MSDAIALIAEPDQALRHSMKQVLLRAGYEVFEIANALQLDVCLRAIPLLVAPSALLVLGAKLADHLTPAISGVAGQRARLGLADLQLVLTYQHGSLPGEPPLARDACRIAGLLEAPFDFGELHAIGLRCRTMPVADGSTNASA